MVVPLPRSDAGVDNDVMAEDIVVGEARWVHEAWDVCGCNVRCARKARTQSKHPGILRLQRACESLQHRRRRRRAGAAH